MILKNWFFWLAAFIIWNILIVTIKKILGQDWPASLKILDLDLPLLLGGVHVMSQDLMGLSILPFLIFAMALFGFAMTLTYAFLEGDIIYRAFFVRYIRTADIVATLAFIVFLILEICQYIV
ncbi:DUF3397 family protein [Ligilactobacillus acidipiscis]|nr:DUF3397 family protein [Ligilactobacillus acidipiscis]GAW64189.1 membrane protein [Ligilactobacillus acidipiscis]GEN20453.1 hypothetical protein LAC02_37340 [Ligilactobacillus acidipiscis]